MQTLQLSDFDRGSLAGREGTATKKAMEFLVRAAAALEAYRLIDIEHCHLVGSYYSGPADLKLLRSLVESGARSRVPTTLNASSACLAGNSPSPETDRDSARAVIELYEAMGADAQLTCAPYHLPYRPKCGTRIAWAESNAVVFANSVLGARTDKTVQYLDLCASLTGRIPEYGLYRDENRHPTCLVDCSGLSKPICASPLGAELIGLWLGYNCGTKVPILAGLQANFSEDQLRGLGAAAASAGGLSLFHIKGVTPEADQFTTDNLPVRRLPDDELDTLFAAHAGSPGQPVSAVCLGTPHYSITQLRALLLALAKNDFHAGIPFFVTTSRFNRDLLQNELLLGELTARGVEVVVDTCSYYGRAIPRPEGAVLTDSAKWAYYGSGNLGVPALLGDLDDCMATASSGRLTRVGSSPWR